MAWYDNAGLYRKFGTEKTAVNRAGEYVTYGPNRTVEVRLNLTSLSTSPAIQSDTTFFPKMRVEQIDLVNFVAATGSTATLLYMGLQATTRSSELDYDGFIADFPIASFNSAGEKTSFVVGGSTSGGALLGTTTTQPGYITAHYSGSSFTAGVADVRIHYAASSS